MFHTLLLLVGLQAHHTPAAPMDAGYMFASHPLGMALLNTDHSTLRTRRTVAKLGYRPARHSHTNTH